MDTSNQGRDIDAVTAAVSWADMDEVATSAWPEARRHVVETIARLQELGYTITKGPDGKGQAPQAPDRDARTTDGGRK
jgi:hypothetical protein